MSNPAVINKYMVHAEFTTFRGNSFTSTPN